MNPAFSIILFTTVAGAAQGLVVFLALAELAGLGVAPGVVVQGLVLALLGLLVGLVASFFHLGRPMLAWRAVMMWRTSWMSREVIILPAFIGLVALWAWAVQVGVQGSLRVVLPLLAIVGAGLLWWCTAMIYACLRFVQEWAHPLTTINYTLIGLASGLVQATVLMDLNAQESIARIACGLALGVTLLAWLTRGASLRRNDRLKPKSTIQSATGLQAARVVQTAMGMTGGSFNTREFFHGASMGVLRRLRVGFQVMAFALPAAIMVLALAQGSYDWMVVAVVVQFAGVLAERWFFFAQARHPQNLYYQVVS